jgi:integrase/recombinase XerD
MSIPVITIFVRHGSQGGKPCKYAGDEFSKRCTCPKHFRWTQNGKQHRKKSGARSWVEAENAKRALEAHLSGDATREPPKAKSVADAVSLFIQDKTVQGVSPFVLADYHRELIRFRDFAENAGAFTVQRIDRELITGYCSTWAKYKSGGRVQRKKYVSGFLRYCVDAGWMDRAPKLPKIAVDTPPTMPLTPDEFQRLLAAVPLVVNIERERKRTRALFLLMRYTGLAIRDALTLKRSEIQKKDGMYLVTTARQKTGTHVSVPIPPAVAEEVLSAETDNPQYVFFHGNTDGKNLASTWSTERIGPIFKAARIPDVCQMKSHRLRDTFAVDLLQKGIPIGEVSKLLGHSSISTTERHYAAWVKGRQDRLNALVTATWSD